MTSASSIPAISLPKGGGALSGVGEKFTPDLHTGTGNFSVPIAVPSGRGGLQPDLTLVYSTGTGNGPFGLGWKLNVPCVSRKTSRGIPRYDDSTDVFILSGAEDLVPVDVRSGVTRYRPRTEGLFAEILHYRDPANSYWEVRSANGLRSFYGTKGSLAADPATGSDPANPARIFEWRITRTEDPFGNRIEYEYERDSAREGPRHWDQLYLKRIRYADCEVDSGTLFLVSINFAYEDRARLDPFSRYRSGFEIRTRKRCSRIVTRTHAGEDRDVRSLELVYADQRGDAASQALNSVSLLSQVQVTGHDGGMTQRLPPLEFGYSRFEPGRRDFSVLKTRDWPVTSLAHPDLALVDLFGNGLPSLVELNAYPRYWRNLGNGRFDLPRFMKDSPANLALSDAGVQLLDATGDGRADLLATSREISGYIPLSFSGEWDRRSFRRFQSAPSFDLKDPEVKLVDLDGDGVTDAIRSGTRLEYFFNDPDEGWRDVQWAERRPLEVFPNVSFADPRVKWGDFTGDGLQSIALIHDGNVEYWPNLGHGRWGERIHMERSPRFPYGYDPRRIILGDVDGDGLVDLVYVEDGKVTLWINQSGNRWSDPVVVHGTPPVNPGDDVRLADVLGSGIEGVLWSRDASRREQVCFLDFTGGRKPYLLQALDNHIGAVTRIEYAPSTRYYLADAAHAERRWRTHLPFPVHVVARVEAIDHFSGGKLTTAYQYHDGHWDGTERELRGFGFVEQFDSESFEISSSGGLHGAQTVLTALDRKYFAPPTRTSTWFHVGPVEDESGEWRDLDRSDQYWAGDSQQLAQAQTVNAFLGALPPSPNARRIRRDALRSLRGSVLRTETYALDGSDHEDRPFVVTESCYSLRQEAMPEASADRLRIFFPYRTGQRTTQWERGSDPMTQLVLTEEFDSWGQPRLQIQIACPRGWRAVGDRPAEAYLATRRRTEYGSPQDPEVHIRDRVSQTINHELLQTAGKTIAELREQAIEGIGSALIDHTVSYYDGEAFEGLSFGQVGRYGALVRNELLAFTGEQVQAAFDGEPPAYFGAADGIGWPASYPNEFKTLLPPHAGYFFRSGAPHTEGFYIAADRRCYDFQQGLQPRGLIVAARDPLGHHTTIDYDEYRLVPLAISDAAGLKTRAEIDYRLLQPFRVTDPNDNLAEVTFTPLGLVKASFVRGRNGEGDQSRPGVVMEYGLDAFDLSPPANRQPIFVRTTRHVHHDADADVPLPARDEVIERYEYSDGFGRALQTRGQAEDDLYGDDVFGRSPLAADQVTAPGDFVGQRRSPDGPPNVLVDGWRVYDNKGRVVEAFEPFFSAGWRYLSAQQEADRHAGEFFGNKLSTFYDSRGRVVKTLNADGSEQRVVFGVPGTIAGPRLIDPGIFEPTPWESYTYDANDNAGRTHPAEAGAYEHHWNTPSSVRIDALGRAVESVSRNRASAVEPIEEYRIVTSYDIRGNVTSVSDALGRQAFRYEYDHGNRRVRMDSLDAGVRRTAFDALGQPVEQSDSKGAWILHAYDGLNRLSRTWARDSAASALGLRLRVEYGDGGVPDQPAAERTAQRAANRLGRPYRQYDEAGLLTSVSFDFRGNLIERERRVISDDVMLGSFAAPPADWQVQAFRMSWQSPPGTTLDAYAESQLDPARYRTSTRPDGLGRVRELLYPVGVDGTRRKLATFYNRAGALERVSLDGQVYIDHVAYSARGQRTLVAYGNGVLTAYAHDPQTVRLRRLWSGRYTKPAGSMGTYRPVSPNLPLQDLAYDHDLAGNIRRISDRTPGCGVINTDQGRDALDRLLDYDAVYRLISATGRESSNIPAPRPWTDDPRHGYNSGTHGAADQDNAPTLTRRYTEEYRYDPAGNLVWLRHGQGANAWVRYFGIGGLGPQDWQQQWAGQLNAAGSWADPPANRLTHVGDDQALFPQTHFFDGNGNLVRETTSRHFEWDHNDRLKAFRTQVANSEPSIYALYLYDAAGQRVKKLVRRQGGAYSASVHVDGVFEHHRRKDGAASLENNSLHVMDGASRVALVRIGNAFPDDASPEVGYHLGDHLGSSAVVIGSGGNWINRQEYTPYGETSFGGYSRKRYRFAGKERDEESGLNYHGARYYAPWLARWTACDPVLTGANLYLFVADHPLQLVDDEGAEPALPEAVGKKGDCSTAKVHPKAYPQPPGPGLVQSFKDAKRSFVDGVLWGISLGDVHSVEESDRKYEAARSDPSIPPQGKPTPLTNEIVNETPSASGDLWLSWAGAQGPKRPAPPAPVGGAATKSVKDILKDLVKASLAGTRVSIETVKDMLRATKRLVDKATKERPHQLLESEVEFVLEDPGAGKWASYGGTKADVVTWDSFKSPATGKVRVRVDPKLMAKPGDAMQKMAHELYELQGLKEKLKDTPGGMTREATQQLIDELHSQAIKEEARVLDDWITLRREAQ